MKSDASSTCRTTAAVKTSSGKSSAIMARGNSIERLKVLQENTLLKFKCRWDVVRTYEVLLHGTILVCFYALTSRFRSCSSKIVFSVLSGFI